MSVGSLSKLQPRKETSCPNFQLIVVALPADQLNEIPSCIASLRSLSGKPQHYVSSFQPQIKLLNGHNTATAKAMHAQAHIKALSTC